jgi:hypothetical protein
MMQSHGGNRQIRLLQRLINPERRYLDQGAFVTISLLTTNWLKCVRNLVNMWEESDDQSTSTQRAIVVLHPPISTHYRLNAIIRIHRRLSWPPTSKHRR